MSRARLVLPSLALLAAWVVLSAGRPTRSPRETAPCPEQQRIAALEARVAELEAFLAQALGYGLEDAAEVAPPARELVLPASVTRKHFLQKDAAHARWEDYLDMDLAYDTSVLDRPAVAIKGELVFADPFGEVQYRIPTQVNDRIEPGEALRHKGLRIEYNQFRREHRWLQTTKPGDMVVGFRVSTVRYRDGSSEEYD